MIKADSVAEEYEIIQKTTCPCGGSYEPIYQSLILPEPEEGSGSSDILNCECTSCGKEKDFYFDISSFFGMKIDPILVQIFKDYTDREIETEKKRKSEN